jgi:hypothetical protein
LSAFQPPRKPTPGILVRDRGDDDHVVAGVPTALGPERFEHATRQGGALTLDQAIEYAMRDGE